MLSPLPFGEFMNRNLFCLCVSFFAAMAGCAHSPPPSPRGALLPDAARQQYESITPSLVAIQYVWESELGRHEIIGAGVVVGDDGLVMTPLALLGDQIPDEQMKEFKIIVPRDNADPLELDAVFQGRDERNEVAFLKTREPQKWKSIKFVEDPPQVGDTVFSVGLLPKEAGYKSYFMGGTVAANLRGEMPQVVVNGGLAAIGSPVFNAQGHAIGLVPLQPGQSLLLNNEADALNAIFAPPKLFVPTRFFDQSFGDLPTPGNPLKLPWIGVPQLTGLTKDVAEVFNLQDQPAIQVGDVIRDAPADRAGLKQGDIIVKVNGLPLERGDQPEELPQIFRRKILRMKPGEQVVLSVLRRRGQPLQDITITLSEQPPRANTAKRYFADDLGYAVRDAVFVDTYARHLPADAKGVVVAVIRPQSSAETGGLQFNDFIQRLNGEPVTDVAAFQTAYEQLRKDKPKESVVLVVLREGREDTIRIEPPQ
jgi:serine protease Do